MQTTVYPAFSAAEIERIIAHNDEIVFAPGTYCLDRPLRLNGLTGRRLIGRPGAVLSGVQRETVRWQSMGEGVFSAQIGAGRAIDGLRTGELRLRPARYPHAADPDAIYEGTAADALNFAARCAHPEDGVLHVLHAHLWGDMHYRIAGREPDGSLRLEGGHQNNRGSLGLHREFRFVEGLREALGAPGEFFYDRRTGELLVCAAEQPPEEILLIVNPYLLDMRGCKGIRFEGLTFADGARTFMGKYEILLRSDWSIHRGGAVFIEDSSDVAFEDCELRDIGSNALFFSGNVSGCAVRECYMHDIGASAVCFVGKPSSVRFPCMTVDTLEFYPEDLTGVGPKSDEHVRDCVVENCLIRDIGLVEKQVSCVEISMSARIRVAHCTLHTCPRAAINISEGTFGGHVLEHNDVFDTVRETGDHGAFNGWGRDRFWHACNMDAAQMKAASLLDAVETSYIRANRMRCDHGWDIDLDDGCSNYVVEDNLCLNGGLKFREGFHRVARRNRIINNSFHPHVWYGDSGDIFEDNLVMRPYLPIGMPERWGARVDNNILAIAGEARPATELMQQSGQDGASVAMPVEFDDLLNPLLGDRFPKNESYGVTSPRLRALAMECPIDPPSVMVSSDDGERLRIGDAVFKGIDTDGEMSAFATPGHKGVIVLSLPSHLRWCIDGLNDNTVIITFNGTLVEGIKHFRELYDALGDGDPIVFGVRTMKNGAHEVHTVKQ